MSELVKTKSFKDENARPEYDISGQASMLNYRLGSNVNLEEGWFEFDPEKFPHVSTEIANNIFLHGGATVYIFEGPLFDKVLADG